MTRREQIKKEIDEIEDSHLETLHRIIVALKFSKVSDNQTETEFKDNPLKNSIIFENDIISPLDELWSANQ
jgi:hypothetical protein